MIGRRFIQRNAQEFPQRKAVAAPPSDAALAVDVLEIADHQHPEIQPRRNARLASLLLLGVILLAAPFDPFVELGLGQKLIQLLVEGMPVRSGQIRRRDEQRLLPLLSFSHRHRTRPPCGSRLPPLCPDCTLMGKGITSTGCYAPLTMNLLGSQTWQNNLGAGGGPLRQVPFRSPARPWWTRLSPAL